MTNVRDDVVAVLVDVGIEVFEGQTNIPRALAFESDTIIGFVVVYDRVEELLDRWRADADELTRERRFQLRAAGTKAWNVYLVLLANEDVSFSNAMALGLIEENLEGMRKIARAGVSGYHSVRSALLSLLPIGAEPVLEPVDMRAEIRVRTTELGEPVVEAFLGGANDAVVLQILEEQS